MKIRAPELEPSLAWINTDTPLAMKALRGQIVILDFWTYCCINCAHTIEVLREMEQRHRDDPVVVIGVHSAKFESEADPDRIRAAVQRFGIEHPVVVDREMGIWERYAVRSWPTLVCVRPDGTIAAVAPGEPDPDTLEAFVREQLDEARRAGTLSRTPFRAPRAASTDDTPLRFPGKVAVASDGRLAISDSGHHRVLVTTPEGRVQSTVGSGRRGWVDGTFDEAAFDDPQGLAWNGDVLWVCDARNHAVRRIDLVRRTVETVAGTGEMAPNLVRERRPARSVALRSPWDIVVRGNTLYVAMAGSHQIWTLDTLEHTAGPFAGSGREALVDGPLEHAAFAQPSGLALADDQLYVADSETSSVRAIDLANRTVRTLVGAGLFDFGDVDGAPSVARLQHALGVAIASDGAVIVADTYNDKIKRIDPADGRVDTFFVGTSDRALHEPGAVTADRAGGFVVADTNRHRVVRIGSVGAWDGVVAITGASAPARGDVKRAARAAPARRAETAGWFSADVAPDGGRSFGPGDVVLTLALRAPDPWKIAAGSPLHLALEVSRRSDLFALAQSEFHLTAEDGPIVLRVRASVSELPAEAIGSEVLATVDAVLCASGDAARCVPARSWFRLPIVLARSGGSTVRFELPLAAPRDA